MQWGKIKVLFIICFFILNIFLVRQIKESDEETFSYINESSKEEELTLNISGLDRLDNQIYEAPLLYVDSYDFEEDAELPVKVKDQEVMIVNNKTLFARLKKPTPLPKISEESGQVEIGEYVYLGNNYERYRYLEKAGIYVLFQKINYPIFYNEQGILFILVNEKHEITHYMLRALDDAEEEEIENQKLLTQYDVIYRLYHQSPVLQTGDEVTNMTLGYHNLVSLPNGEQLLNPTWKIEVNKTDDYFVNAIEGHDYPQNNQFMSESIGLFLDEMLLGASAEYRMFNIEDRDDFLTRFFNTLNPIYNDVLEEELAQGL